MTLTTEKVRELFFLKNGELWWRNDRFGRKIDQPAGSVDRSTGYRRVWIEGKLWDERKLLKLYDNLSAIQKVKQARKSVYRKRQVPVFNKETGYWSWYYNKKSHKNNILRYVTSEVVVTLQQVAVCCDVTMRQARQVLKALVGRELSNKTVIPSKSAEKFVCYIDDDEEVDKSKAKAELILDREIRYLQKKKEKVKKI